MRDLHTTTRMLTIARAVVEMSPRHRAPVTDRFQVKNYPKDREYRRVKLSTPITAVLATHITAQALDADEPPLRLP